MPVSAATYSMEVVAHGGKAILAATGHNTGLDTYLVGSCWV
jgi:hypothetical protein